MVFETCPDVGYEHEPSRARKVLRFEMTQVHEDDGDKLAAACRADSGSRVFHWSMLNPFSQAVDARTLKVSAVFPWGSEGGMSVFQAQTPTADTLTGRVIKAACNGRSVPSLALTSPYRHFQCLKSNSLQQVLRLGGTRSLALADMCVLGSHIAAVEHLTLASNGFYTAPMEVSLRPFIGLKELHLHGQVFVHKHVSSVAHKADLSALVATLEHMSALKHVVLWRVGLSVQELKHICLQLSSRRAREVSFRISPRPGPMEGTHATQGSGCAPPQGDLCGSALQVMAQLSALF